MGLDLNNFWNFTKSQKISRSAYIVDLIANKIDNNQHIKRFMRYNTVNPLAKRSTTYEGISLIQKDLTDSLKIKSSEIKDSKQNIIDSDTCLYLRAFNDDMTINKQNYIFVENKHNVYNNDMATMYFRIHILTPAAYLDIVDETGDIQIARNKAIACIIDDMLDKYIVDDDKYSKLVGNVDFKLTDYGEDRLSNSNDIIKTTLVYRVDTLGFRTNTY